MNARIKSWLVAMLVALATMAIVVVANWPNALNAKAPAPAKLAALAFKTPTLGVHGCTLSILPVPKGTTGDQEYVISIKAVNTTDKPVTFDMTVAVQSMSLRSMFSRMPARPTESWKRGCPVSLLAGETTIINVATGKKASALGAMLTPHVIVDGKHLRGRPFTALVKPPPAPRPAPPKPKPNRAALLKTVAAGPGRTAAIGG